MATTPEPVRHAPDWVAIERDPRFQALHQRKGRFLWTLLLLSIAFYLLLPIGAGWFPELFARKVWGPVNVGLLFALSEFAAAWSIAFVYERVANRHFDPMTAEIRRAAGDVEPTP